MLYVSKLDIYKNQLKIISVINYLKKKFDITLSLIGSYDKKNKKILLNEIKKYNLSKNIKILGKIDYHKLPKIYHKHDIKIYASKSETFGMTMLEAIKSGLPVLAIKNQISKEILSEAGFFCYNSTKNIQNTILKIINNKKLLKKKIILGKKIAEKYNWKITSKKTFNFLEKVRG